MKKEINSKKIGLALGGGSVLGATHIGVLKALEENNIKPDYIAGTSIGAIIGALYAFGKNSEEIEKIALDLGWTDISSISLSKYALLSNKKLGKLLIKNIGDVNIEDSKIPLSIVATDIETGKKVALKKGNLGRAVIASSCLPGVFVPEEIDDKLLIDGGVVENVPVKTVAEMGADHIIGVDLYGNYKGRKPDSVLGVLINAFNYLMAASTNNQTEDADVMIKPELSSFSKVKTKHIKALIEIGYKEAKKNLDCKKFW